MARKPLTIIDLYSTEMPFATEFRRLLRRVNNSQGKDAHKALLITSAMLSEGKSTVASFLGLTSARLENRKTLIVDADLRRPSIHKYFSVPRDKGLAEILTHDLEPHDSIKHTALEQLDLVTAGIPVNRPSDVFNAEGIRQLVDEMKFTYDLIIIDCAPILPVSDPMLLASKLDGVVMIVKAGATQIEVVQRAVKILNADQDYILGVVLNNMNNSLPYYYDYRYYGYEQTDKGSRSKSRSRRNSSDSGSKKLSKRNKGDTQPKGTLKPS